MIAATYVVQALGVLAAVWGAWIALTRLGTPPRRHVVLYDPVSLTPAQRDRAAAAAAREARLIARDRDRSEAATDRLHELVDYIETCRLTEDADR